MALDITLPIAVRASGPALFALLGLSIAALSRGRVERAAIGVYFAGLGLSLVLSNLAIAGGGGPLFYAALGCAMSGSLAALAWGALLARRVARTRIGLVAILALGIVYAALSSAFVPALVDGNALFRTFTGSTRDAFLAYANVIGIMEAGILVLPLAWALQAWATREDDREAAGLSAGLLVFAGFGAGMDFLSGTNAVFFVQGPSAVIAIVAASFTWLALAARTQSRRARNVALAGLAALLAGMLRHATSGDAVLDPIGAPGIARLVGWAIIATTVAHAGWLDVRFLSRHRAGLAFAALAALFIVAQVAQNFLSAEYGLLTGGVVAGAFLFAASPIQRAFEARRDGRSVARDMPTRETAAHHSADEDVYRNALRVALRDKVLTRDEEVHLHRLAVRLDIPGDRAHELLIEVERELGGRTP